MHDRFCYHAESFLLNTIKGEFKMNEFLKLQEELLEELSSSAQMGLTAEQVNESRAKHGANVLTRQKQGSLCTMV